MKSSGEALQAMQSTLVGEVEDFRSLMNFRTFKVVEGWPETQMRYLGGLKMLLEFERNMDMENFLLNEKLWRPWFKTLKNWHIKENLNERVASLIIMGIPQHIWCQDAFSVVANRWGRVIIPEECPTDSTNMAFGRVGIITNNPGSINSSVKITVDGWDFDIIVIEDTSESLRLNPATACNDIYNVTPGAVNKNNWNNRNEIDDEVDKVFESSEEGVYSHKVEVPPEFPPEQMTSTENKRLSEEEAEGSHVSNTFPDNCNTHATNSGLEEVEGGGIEDIQYVQVVVDNSNLNQRVEITREGCNAQLPGGPNITNKITKPFDLNKDHVVENFNSNQQVEESQTSGYMPVDGDSTHELVDLNDDDVDNVSDANNVVISNGSDQSLRRVKNNNRNQNKTYDKGRNLQQVLGIKSMRLRDAILSTSFKSGRARSVDGMRSRNISRHRSGRHSSSSSGVSNSIEVAKTGKLQNDTGFNMDGSMGGLTRIIEGEGEKNPIL